MKYKLAIILSTLLLTCSCGYEKGLTPAQPKGFIERKSTNLVSDKTPFNYVWQDKGNSRIHELRDRGRYSLYIAPVSTDLLDFKNKDEDLEDRAVMIGEYLKKQITLEINNRDGQFINASVVDTASKADIRLEIALTELGLGSPLLYTSAWLLPLPGTGTAVDSMYQPVLAMEARLIDTGTNNSVVEMADRKIPKVRILDLNKVFSKNAPMRDICNEWAKVMATGLQTRLDKETLPRNKRFTIIPW